MGDMIDPDTAPKKELKSPVRGAIVWLVLGLMGIVVSLVIHVLHPTSMLDYYLAVASCLPLARSSYWLGIWDGYEDGRVDVYGP